MDLQQEIQETERRLAELRKKREDQSQYRPCEVTFCMCAYHDCDHVCRVLRRLWAQGLVLDVLVAVDEASIDVTRDILASPRLESWLKGHRSAAIRSVKYIGEIPHRQNLEDTLAFAKAAFIEHVQTEFVWWADADVYLDAGTIRTALQFMKSRSDLGAVTVPYTLKSDHKEQGAMLMRTAVAKEMGFDGRPDKTAGTRCVCMNIARDLAARGLKVEDVPDMDSFHGKWGS